MKQIYLSYHRNWNIKGLPQATGNQSAELIITMQKRDAIARTEKHMFHLISVYGEDGSRRVNLKIKAYKRLKNRLICSSPKKELSDTVISALREHNSELVRIFSIQRGNSSPPLSAQFVKELSETPQARDIINKLKPAKLADEKEQLIGNAVI